MSEVENQSRQTRIDLFIWGGTEDDQDQTITEVRLTVTVTKEEGGGFSATLRYREAETLDEVIDGLIQARRDVWPDAPERYTKNKDE